ncbi:MAG: dihydrolipoyl dehydrogenase [Clostridium sp.]|nr:dihydrolipoyl dehydrogenase [Clostridium sp.]
MHTPLLIIGAGPGGYETALHAAQRGIETTIIEAGPAGGTCLNEGCIPTKALCRTAQLLDDMHEAASHGIALSDTGFSLAHAIGRKNRIVDELRKGVDGLLTHKLIHRVNGKAIFADAHTVTVEGMSYEADHIIIATGSVSQSLPVPGTDLPGVVTSREMLALQQVPQRLCVIGGGVIGLELASVYRSFGSEVCVVEYAKEILPRFDSDLAKRLRKTLADRGIEFITQAAVTGIRQTGGALTVDFERKGKADSREADCVLMAVGRKANVDSLNLTDIGIEFTARGIAVDDNMQTNLPHIYAIGDINGRQMLAHAAVSQGQRALNHLCGLADNIRPDVMPAAVFTRPEAASVGLTEEECKERGIRIRCGKAFFRSNGKALCMGEPDGFCKLIAAEEDHRLLGCHLYGPHAADLIQEACTLISLGATIEQCRDIIHTHPTLGEVVQAALQNL